VGENYYFGRPPEAERTDKDSPFRQFIVRCLKCRSYKLRVISEYDDEGGEFKAYLFCPSCKARELLPMR